MAGWVYRENNVPHYQRLFQAGNKKHIRQWSQTPKSKIILPLYYVMLFGSFSASMYMIGRQIFGHKTWFGKG
ncbi:hypothetical protein K402DRAFT_391570 [Aulographum hederae CBS 113979]|uniref:Uncharacterized protein n=1 Tax=Aulographum hederae CBS 113979 TaxID=1176131 RepID=A0A6G1H6L6_9PEZI|nr:hypothetical protein K402DRAFT_391570 [Aulographum hederae CBS 113979]